MSETKGMPEGEDSPWILISHLDRERLSSLAVAMMDRMPGVASQLLAELGRAEIVPADKIPLTVVVMHSRVEYIENGTTHRITLVYPGEADMAQDKISVLTPVGAALIGLSIGQSITWRGPDGSLRQLTVLAVQPCS